MRIRTFCIIPKRIRFGRLIGLTVSVNKPHYGVRVEIEWCWEVIQPGTAMWQMYQ